MPYSALENCSQVYSLVHSLPFQTSNLAQFVLSGCTLISIFYGLYTANQTARQARRVQAYRIQFSLWIILMTGLFLYSILSIQVVVLKTYGFIQLIFNTDPCKFLWSKQTCLLVKFPISSSIVGYNLLAVILLLERIAATHSVKSYSRYGKVLGLCLIFLAVSRLLRLLNTGMILATSEFYHSSLHVSLNLISVQPIFVRRYKGVEVKGPPAFCLTTLLTSYRKISNIMTLFVFANIATMFGVALLFFVSRRQMDR
jgi:hypothetical protein